MIEERANGKVKFNIFPSGALSTAVDAYRSAATGIVDISFGWSHFGPADKPALSVIQLPFAPYATNGLQASWVMQKMYEEGFFNKDLGDTQLLALFTLHQRVIHTVSPVNKMEDLKGKRIADGGPDTIALLEALGATGIGIPPGPERYTAFEKKAIDGILIAWEAMEGYNYWDFCKYHVNQSMENGSFFITMNKDKYNSLPPDVKEAIDHYSGMWLSEFSAKAWAKKDIEIMELLKTRPGHTVVNLAPDEAARWQALGPNLWKGWLARLQERGYDGQKLIDRAVQLGEEYVKTKK